ncbi:MAG: 3-deoxy-D-manno-octulosonic acid transferase, partial [Verrucomicrobia bacterium]|nr:3-deoxy-D-manno-octulosonic acid transferase [Verrucomicrobiota bacterium]
VAALRQRAPELRLLLSTTTTTGFALAQERVASAGWDDEGTVAVLYTPLDFLPCAALAWRALARPAGVVVVEGGLWPNLLALARRDGRPAALVNARLSPRSERRFRRARALTAPLLFRPLSLLTAPEPADRARWTALGADPARIQITGSMKFDDSSVAELAGSGAAAADERRERLRAELAAHGLQLDPARPVLLAGSTHAGEELLVAQQWRRLRQRDARLADLGLVIAPRHVERTGAVRAQLEAALGLRGIARSELGKKSFDEVAGADFVLLDTTGELRDWFALATVVFIGKSLATHVSGGQNPVEPLAAGRPVIFGPRMENFADIVAQLLAVGGAVQVPAAADALGDACAHLLVNADARAQLVARGQTVLASHHGAAARTAAAVLALLAR